jgi:hypothetical protein
MLLKLRCAVFQKCTKHLSGVNDVELETSELSLIISKHPRVTATSPELYSMLLSGWSYNRIKHNSYQISFVVLAHQLSDVIGEQHSLNCTTSTVQMESTTVSAECFKDPLNNTSKVKDLKNNNNK